jgi:hypothetical protein
MNLTINYYPPCFQTRRVKTWQIWQIWREVIKVLLPEVDLGDPLFYGENVQISVAERGGTQRNCWRIWHGEL